MGDRRHKHVFHDSSSEDEDAPRDISEDAYKSLQTTEALRGDNYCAATQELVQLLDDSACSKGALALLIKDVALAIQCCRGSTQERLALASLMESVERRLPQAKRKELLRGYKKGSMALRRKEKKGSNSSGAAMGDSDSSDEEREPATFCHLPLEVVSSVFAYLSPLDLARAACVCSQWKELSAEGQLWDPLLAGTFSRAQRAKLLQQAQRALGRRAAAAEARAAAAVGAGGKAAAGSGAGGKAAAADAPVGGRAEGGGSEQTASLQGSLFQLAFALGARRYPQAVLVWKTNRVLRQSASSRAGRLCWLTPFERQAILGSCLGAAGDRDEVPASLGRPTARGGRLGRQGGASPRQAGAGGTAQRSASGRAGAGAGACQWRPLSAPEVVEFLRRGGRLPPSPVDYSSGSASDSDSEGEAGALSTRLKFWRVE